MCDNVAGRHRHYHAGDLRLRDRAVGDVASEKFCLEATFTHYAWAMHLLMRCGFSGEEAWLGLMEHLPRLMRLTGSKSALDWLGVFDIPKPIVDAIWVSDKERGFHHV